MDLETQIFKGIGASRGIAIGWVRILDRRRIQIPRYHISPSLVEKETERLRGAIILSYTQLASIRSKFIGPGMDHHLLSLMLLLLLGQYRKY